MCLKHQWLDTCGAKQGLLLITQCEKEQDVTGEGDHMEVGLHFSGTNILVLDSGDKHSTVQSRCRNEAEKQTWTVDQRLTQ